MNLRIVCNLHMFELHLSGVIGTRVCFLFFLPPPPLFNNVEKITFGKRWLPLGMTTWTKFNEFSENNVALFSGRPKICNEIHPDWRDPSPLFPKIHCFYRPKIFEKNRNEIFWIGNDPRRLRYSTDSLFVS